MDAGLTSRHDATEASRKIYTPELIGALGALLDEAACVAEGVCARRVAWIRREYLKPLSQVRRQI